MRVAGVLFFTSGWVRVRTSLKGSVIGPVAAVRPTKAADDSLQLPSETTRVSHQCVRGMRII